MVGRVQSTLFGSGRNFFWYASLFTLAIPDIYSYVMNLKHRKKEHDYDFVHRAFNSSKKDLTNVPLSTPDMLRKKKKNSTTDILGAFFHALVKLFGSLRNINAEKEK